LCRHVDDVMAYLHRAREAQRLEAFRPSVLSIPSLPLLAYVDHFEHVGAGPFDALVLYSPKVRERYAFNRRRGKKEIPDRRMGSLRETLQLLESRAFLLAFPPIELREFLA